ncbi:transcription factor Adf-1-like [Colias croceus]|uniref:transcription factor Adf-1-like n=1 Tax=Colias crocea TaxID=72248 RepID=UPI001E27C9B1|nr:transcription factor Adf-1-like [Colias croceus]
MSTFSDNDEEKLINIVAGHPFLYDISNQNYRNKLVKDNVWKAIGKDLNKNSDECKKKWKAIRDGYHRFKKKHKLGTGSATPKHSKGKRHLLLSFLESVPEHRSGGSNIPSSPRAPQSNEEDSVDNLLSSNEQEGSKDGAMSYAEQDSDNDDTTKVETENKQKINLDFKTKVLKEDSILKVWKERDEKRESLIKTILKKKDDDIDLFVRHIGEVLRNLPQVEKAQAKKHLYEVLSEYEIMAAKKLSNSSST